MTTSLSYKLSVIYVYRLFQTRQSASHDGVNFIFIII